MRAGKWNFTPLHCISKASKGVIVEYRVKQIWDCSVILFQDLKVQMVVWMLQRHLLVQLHTYVFFVPPVPRRKKKVSEEWNILDGTLQRSPSFSDNASGRRLSRAFLPISRGRISAPFPIKNSHLFSQYHV